MNWKFISTYSVSLFRSRSWNGEDCWNYGGAKLPKQSNDATPWIGGCDRYCLDKKCWSWTDVDNLRYDGPKRGVPTWLVLQLPSQFRIQENHSENEDYRLCTWKSLIKVFIPWAQWRGHDNWALSYWDFGRHKITYNCNWGNSIQIENIT